MSIRGRLVPGGSERTTEDGRLRRIRVDPPCGDGAPCRCSPRMGAAAHRAFLRSTSSSLPQPPRERYRAAQLHCQSERDITLKPTAKRAANGLANSRRLKTISPQQTTRHSGRKAVRPAAGASVAAPAAASASGGSAAGGDCLLSAAFHTCCSCGAAAAKSIPHRSANTHHNGALFHPLCCLCIGLSVCLTVGWQCCGCPNQPSR